VGTNTQRRDAQEGGVRPTIAPAKLAHYALRTSQFEPVLTWYQQVLGAKIVFEGSGLAFLTYDDEHHRLVIIEMPGLASGAGSTTGVHHVAFTYRTLADLLETYERLSELGINPVLPINHGPTTSLYYMDPDRNQVELQVENFDTVEEASAFFYSDAFRENPVGTDFDPREMLQRLRAGTPEGVLKRRVEIGARSPQDVPLH
jgi:catechol 2,3-dioxygenase-like lactoylglutathione lyase family enzyme